MPRKRKTDENKVADTSVKLNKTIETDHETDYDDLTRSIPESVSADTGENEEVNEAQEFSGQDKRKMSKAEKKSRKSDSAAVESSNTNIHSGHRKRLREEFVNSGLNGFSDVRTLELVLSYAIPRRDTNVIAHALLDRFKKLENVFSASIAELKAVPGMGESSAILIKLVLELQKKNQTASGILKRGRMSGVDEAGRYIQSFFIGARDEKLMLFCLDASNKLIQSEEIASGVVNHVTADVRRIAELALNNKSSVCILAHNHPDGILNPSQDDIEVTKRVSSALNALDIRLVDHFIITPDDYYSFSGHGLI